jgi:hypothetical protein|tara:strand:+ start:154 stop:393 length:240 start_codon:yes stop_codon:yes gene_type:complete
MKISDTWGDKMLGIEVFVYFVLFAIIAGSAFAMMYANIQSINVDMKRKPHPEAPASGEEVMYVDLSREKLERLYKGDDT